MKSYAPSSSFFLNLLLKPGSQKNAFLLETGHEDSFRLCGNFLLAICSQPQPILLRDLNNEGLKDGSHSWRKDARGQGSFLNLQWGLCRSRFLGWGSPLLRQAQEAKEIQGLLQGGVRSGLRSLGFSPLCCREAVSTKVNASPGLRGSLHRSNLTALLKRVFLSAAVTFKPQF